MKTIKIISAILLTFLMVTSCDWISDETVVGSGDVEIMEVEATSFSGVSVTGTCDVKIQIGDVQKVELSAQSQILDVMTYQVRNNILHIGFRDGYNVKTNREISADIVIPSLDYISVTGAGNYDLSGPEQSSLDIYITGTGDVKAFNLEVDNCTINIEGTGNCEVNVGNSLDVNISGIGNVVYMGTPSLTSDISGVGNVTAQSH